MSRKKGPLRISVPLSTTVKLCAVCNKDFITKYPKAKLCGSSECYRTYRNEKTKLNAQMRRPSYIIKYDPVARRQAIRCFNKLGANIETIAAFFGLTKDEITKIIGLNEVPNDQH